MPITKNYLWVFKYACISYKTIKHININADVIYYRMQLYLTWLATIF